MQNSELYRRGVVCPLDQVAEEQLRRNEVDTTTRVRVVEIPDDPTFRALWDLGLFSEINARCGTLIDDYDEELVEASAVAEMIASLDLVIASAADPEILELLAAFRSLACEAEATSRPVLFVL